MLRITPISSTGERGDPVEYPDGVEHRFDPDPYEPGVEQFIVVATSDGDVPYSLWSHQVEVL